MGLLSYCPVTLEQVESWLGISSVTVDIGKNLETITNGVVSLMEQQTRRKLFARDYDYTKGDKEAIRNGNGTSTLWLPEYPVNSISYLSVDDTEITCTNDDYDDDSGYKWWPSGELYYSYGFTEGKKNVLLKYNAGYDSTAPEYPDLQRICLQVIAYYWQRRGLEDKESERIGNYSYKIADIRGFPPMDELLKRFSRRWEL